MDMIYIAAVLIGGTTLIGTACGFALKNVSEIWNDVVTAFASGVMLAAAMFGLFQPAIDSGKIAQTIIGTLFGMIFLRLTAKITPEGSFIRRPELLFVMALILHKFPEGMAGGVGLAAESGMLAAVGIAIQNLPEGVVMIPPLISSGLSKKKTALIALSTGMLNALGVIIGGILSKAANGFLPFTLAFAGGAMLDVILKNMIPSIFRSKIRRAEWIVMSGFLLMTAVNACFTS